jgi:hypothetical protein
MKFILVALGLIACLLAWQHLRYLDARRGAAQDRQSVLHSTSSLHVITFLEAEKGRELIPDISRLTQAIKNDGKGKLIYAGQAGFTVASSRLEPAQWNAVILTEYPSRDAYESASQGSDYRDALSVFSQSYSHGMQRNPLLNLALPQALLALRLADIAKGNLGAAPLEALPKPAEPSAEYAMLSERSAALRSLAAVNSEAVVIFNLSQPGNSAQQAANAGYGIQMLTRMAALAHGPIHIGSAVRLEGDVDFEQVAIVYYPGADYFADLMGSRFFQGIIGDKQLGDTLAVPTVPILSQL